MYLIQIFRKIFFKQLGSIWRYFGGFDDDTISSSNRSCCRHHSKLNWIIPWSNNKDNSIRIFHNNRLFHHCHNRFWNLEEIIGILLTVTATEYRVVLHYLVGRWSMDSLLGKGEGYLSTKIYVYEYNIKCTLNLLKERMLTFYCGDDNSFRTLHLISKTKFT